MAAPARRPWPTGWRPPGRRCRGPTRSCRRRGAARRRAPAGWPRCPRTARLVGPRRPRGGGRRRTCAATATTSAGSSCCCAQVVVGRRGPDRARSDPKNRLTRCTDVTHRAMAGPQTHRRGRCRSGRPAWPRAGLGAIGSPHVSQSPYVPSSSSGQRPLDVVELVLQGGGERQVLALLGRHLTRVGEVLVEVEGAIAVLGRDSPAVARRSARSRLQTQRGRSRPRYRTCTTGYSARAPLLGVIVDRRRSAGDGRPRVGVSVHGAKALGRHQRVDLRGADGGVAEQLLHGPDVGAVVEHVGGAGVAQHMGAQAAFQTGPLAVLRTTPQAPCRDRRPPRVFRNTASASPRRAHRAGATSGRPPGPSQSASASLGEAAERNDPLLCPLAERPEEGVARGRDRAKDSPTSSEMRSPGAVEHLEDGPVAPGDGVVADHGLQEAGRPRPPPAPWAAPGNPWHGDVGRRVASRPALQRQEAVQRAHRHERPLHRRGGAARGLSSGRRSRRCPLAHVAEAAAPLAEPGQVAPAGRPGRR